MLWSQTGAIQNVRTSRQRSCNQRFGWLLGNMVMIYYLQDASWDKCRSMVWALVVVRMAIDLKYRNTPQLHTDTYQAYANVKMFSILKNRIYSYICKQILILLYALKPKQRKKAHRKFNCLNGREGKSMRFSQNFFLVILLEGESLGLYSYGVLMMWGLYNLYLT